MSTLLHVSASPRGERSESLALAETFLASYRDAHPDDEVRHFDLWDGSLPAFGTDAAAAKMAVFAGQSPTGAAGVAWQAARDTFDRFAAADRYLFSVPMWNHGIPYILKQLIDVISQPGLVYGFDPVTGYQGLVTGKRAAVIYTSGVYAGGSDARFGVDFQESYFDDWLRWAGIHDVETITLRPGMSDPEPARLAAHTAARLAARRLHPALRRSA